MSEYTYHFAYDAPDPPWAGPYSSWDGCVFAARRDGYGTGAHDGGYPRTIYIKTMQQLAPGMFVKVGAVQKIEPPRE